MYFLFSMSLLILFLKLEMPPASFAYHSPIHSSMPRSNEASPGLDYSLLRSQGTIVLSIWYAFGPAWHSTYLDSLS